MKNLFFRSRTSTLGAILALSLCLPVQAIELNAGTAEGNNAYGNVEKKASFMMNEYEARAKSLHIPREDADANLQITYDEILTQYNELSNLVVAMVEGVAYYTNCLKDGSCVSSTIVAPKVTVIERTITSTGDTSIACTTNKKKVTTALPLCATDGQFNTGISVNTYQFCAQSRGNWLKDGQFRIYKKDGSWWVSLSGGSGSRTVSINCFAYTAS